MEKGKLIVTGLGILLSIGAVASFVGLDVVEGPEGSFCVAASSEPAE